MLQQASAREQATGDARARHLARLVANPVWLTGIAADVMAYVLQFVALARGPLVIVQPLLVTGLVFALPLGAAVGRRRPSAVEWLGALPVTVGLALFLAVADPATGSATAPASRWAAMVGLTMGPALVLAIASKAAAEVPKAAMLAGSAGIAYGLTAALSKATAHILAAGPVALFEHWQPAALIVVGAFGMLAAQGAFASGPLSASLPTLTVADPLVSLLLGALGFGERISGSGAAPVLEGVGLTLMIFGVLLCGRSPVVTETVPVGEDGN